MSERKYTDEEIIDEVNAYIERSCRMCEFKALCNDLCAIEFIKTALDLITRQKAEIEKLQEVNADLNESLRLAAEANKDLNAEIERLADRSHKCIYLSDEESMEYCVDGPCPHYEAKAKVKAEAIKEFAGKLKETPIELGLPLLGLLTKSEIEGYFNRTLLQVRDAIDNLVAEMTEGK